MLFEDLVNVGRDILQTTFDRAKGVLLAQLGDVMSARAESDRAEFWYPPGLVARPPKAVIGVDATQAVSVRRGDHDVIIATRDRRGTELLGNLQDGETAIYAPGDGTAQARVLLKANGAISVFTRDGNDATGVASVVQLNPDSSIAMQSKHGGLRVDATGVTLTAGEAALTLGADGSIKLQGSGLCEVAGGITAIGHGCTPTPASAALVGPFGAGGLPSGNVFIGISPPGAA